MPTVATVATVAKPTLVFIHGFLGSPDDWLEVVAALDDRYVCLLLTIPERNQQGQALRDWAALIAACEHQWTALLPERFTLIGYSLGGRIAQALSQIWLGRLEALILQGAHPGLGSDLERSQRRRQDRQWSNCFRSEPL